MTGYGVYVSEQITACKSAGVSVYMRSGHGPYGFGHGAFNFIS